MSGGFKKIIANFSYVVLSNLLTVIVSSLVVLILPKIMGVEEYGYWQLYIFYLSYAGFVHLGWVESTCATVVWSMMSWIKKSFSLSFSCF